MENCLLWKNPHTRWPKVFCEYIGKIIESKINLRFWVQTNGYQAELFTETEDNGEGHFREENQNCKCQSKSP